MNQDTLKSSIKINKITILQSLGAEDLKTGIKLLDDIDILNAAYDRELKIEIKDVVSRQDFLRCLRELTSQAESFAEYPVLHIEAHGSHDKNGLIFKNSDFLSWKDIKPYLVELNKATHHNLLVVLATCHGGYLASILTPMERSPCWGMVGPTDVVKSFNLLHDFTRFYEEWLKTGNGVNAVKELNSREAPETIPYYFTTAEKLFVLAYRRYIRDHCGNVGYGRRARKARKTLKKSGKAMSLKKITNIYRITQQPYFEKCRRIFFMLDLDPAIESRISITYRDVIS